MRQPYKIYRDPIPESRRNSTIPFARMKVGDYAAVPAAVATSPQEVEHMAARWAKRHRLDWKFLVCVVDDRLTVWRVK